MTIVLNLLMQKALIQTIKLIQVIINSLFGHVFIWRRQNIQRNPFKIDLAFDCGLDENSIFRQKYNFENRPKPNIASRIYENDRKF